MYTNMEVKIVIVSIDREKSNTWRDEVVSIMAKPLLSVADKLNLVKAITRKYIPYSELEFELNLGMGYVVLKGCPIDAELPAPPLDGVRSAAKTWVSEAILLGSTLACSFNPYGYKQEKNGLLVHEIAPTNQLLNSISSGGIEEFLPHADGAYLPRALRPEVLSLICLNNEANTSTEIARIVDIVNGLSSSDIDLLSSPLFAHESPVTFSSDGVTYTTSSILDRVDGAWEVKVATHSSVALTEEARNALNRFREVTKLVSKSILWEPGDLMIFSNRRCLHSRARINGQRWLQRCYGSSLISLGDVVDLSNYSMLTTPSNFDRTSFTEENIA